MTTTLARKFRVDVTTDLTLASGWTQLNGINDLDPEISPDMEDTSAYDTTGWSTSEPTMQSWTLKATFFRRIVSTVYDPGQELVRACVGQFTTAARCGVRWYDKNAGPEAYSGIAVVGWSRSNTATKNVEQAIATFTGTDIPLNLNISNPISGVGAPIITAVTPGTGATASAIAIMGQGFTGTTGASHVTVGGTNATSYTVISDNLITAVVPAVSAGSAPIIVTNVTGASNSFAWTHA